MWRLHITLCFICVGVFGQATDALAASAMEYAYKTREDTAEYAKPKVGLLSNFLFQFDNRNERYYGSRARMNGLKIGLEFYKRYRTGFGFYSNNQYYRMIFPDVPNNVSHSARLNYVTWFNEFVVFRNFRWELSPSIAIGTGSISLQSFDQSASIAELIRTDTIDNIPLFDYGFQSQFKIFQWFGLGAGVGYRNLRLSNHPQLQAPFSSPYFDFKIKVFLGYAYKALFKPERIEAEKSYYEQRAKIRKAKFRNTFLKK